MNGEPKNYAGLSEAFAIFAKYEPDATYSTQAEHDVIYAGGVPPDSMSQDDVARLEVLRWSWDGDDLQTWYYFT